MTTITTNHEARDVDDLLWQVHYLLTPVSRVECSDIEGQIGFTVHTARQGWQRLWMPDIAIYTAPDWMKGRFVDPDFRLQVAQALNGVSPVNLVWRLPDAAGQLPNAEPVVVEPVEPVEVVEPKLSSQQVRAALSDLNRPLKKKR